MSDDGDEFDALYGDSYDDETLAQAEFVASQAVPGPSQTPIAASISRVGPKNGVRHANSNLGLPRGSRYANGRVLSPPPSKRQRLDLHPAPAQVAPEEEEESLEVIWTENGYVTRASSQRQARRGPGPDDFEIRHSGPGRPPAIGAGYGQSLHEDPWEGEEWTTGAGDVEDWDKAEEEAVRLSQQPGSSKQQQPPPQAAPSRKLGVGVPRQERINNAREAAGLPSPSPAYLPPDRGQGGLNGHAAPSKPAAQPAAAALTGPNLNANQRHELEDLRAQLRAALAETRMSKNKMYAREGEVKMVRERNEKAERELAELRLKAQKQQEEFQKQLEEREKSFAAEKERIDTNAAFFRLEHETSVKRVAWPGSVRRRGTGPGRGIGPAGSQSIGFSQSQYAPPPVMPTTPTRRGRGQGLPSPSTPHRSGSQGYSSPSRRVGLDDSPSKGRDQNRRDDLIAPAILNKTRGSAQKKVAAFPGFDNSFTAELPTKRTPKPVASRLQDISERAGASQTHDIDMTMIADDPVPANQADTTMTSLPQTTFDGKASTIATRQRRYRWAVSALFRRRAALVGLLLAHSSPQSEPPLSLPRSRYVTSSVATPKPVADHTATIHRVLDVDLPTEVRPELRGRQQVATELLLTTMTDGTSGNGGEHRFTFLDLLPDELPADQEALDELDGRDYWDCQEAIDEGMQDLYEDLAVSLRTLLGLYLRLCMTDALQDVMALMTALSVAEPAIINAFMSSELAYELEVPPQASEEMADGVNIAAATQQPGTQQRRRSLTARPPVPTPDQIPSCLIECIRKAGGVLPLRITSPESIAPPEPEPLQVASQRPNATQSRKIRAKAKRDNEASLNISWDMGTDQREDVLETVLSLLEVFVWHIGDQSGYYLKSIFEAPGTIAIFLDVKRPAETIRRFVRLLTQLVQYPDMWKTLVVCKFDPDLQVGLPALVYQSRTPLLDLLAKHLVDLRHNQSTFDAHRLHCGINIFISQLVIKHHDALLLARESQSLFAALVQAIHTDTSIIWNEDGLRRGGEETVAQDIVTRIVLDVSLLSQIFHQEDHPQDLADRLNSHESHLLLNGIRHCFILAFSRLAFADEPSWIPEECVKELGNVADKCSDLIEMVLSPDEVEAVWEICAEEEGDEEQVDEGEEEDEVMLDGEVDRLNGQASRGAGTGGVYGSQTQSESSVPPAAAAPLASRWEKTRIRDASIRGASGATNGRPRDRGEVGVGDDDEEAAMWGAR
ncbi:hypothetical protein BCV69DRAFT_279623 [Microstroma glucosiphilum]|uniref:Uncharacterized protein n=1 Tax=Pseudomicrostroma glucosiphilum TaxID=1684307 RepID=A0A316UIC7_9BASI|nr:hypothetical protein BCV69DRAFT_279623 [Pseudomicrostroma glucosiphilum]PWN23693.1 hypothetical protein BCV69DRAFT_279623 [Pseudomicrostroma glucosiphilum]